MASPAPGGGQYPLHPLESGQPIAKFAAAARERGWPWIAWNRADSPALALAAYQAGARAVLPAAVTADVVRKALAGLPDGQAPVSGRRGGRREYRYRQGNVILPEPDTVVEVKDGILAVSVLHSDGAQVLLGLCGPGQMLVSHPHDRCSVQLVAHTEAAVTLHTWAEVAGRPDFPEQMRRRRQQLEA